MAGTKVVQFGLLISLMIISTNALKLLLTDGVSRVKNLTKIDFEIDEYGERCFNGWTINKTYTPGTNTTTVIVYIKRLTMMTAYTLRRKYMKKRIEIADVLREHNYELLYLGVGDYSLGDERLVGEFLLYTIIFIDALSHFEIFTIGEETMDIIFDTSFGELNKYKEEENIFDKNLQAQLRSMDAK